MYASVTPVSPSPSLPALLGRYRCFGKCSSREIESLSRPECEDDGPPRQEVAFLKMIGRQVVALGATTWTCMPITGILSWYGLPLCCYAFVGIKFCSTTVLQLAICRQLDSTVRDHTLEPPLEIEAAAKALETPSYAGLAGSGEQQCAVSVWEPCVATVSTAALMFFRALEAVDPDSDAMTAGVAHHSFSATDQKLFAASWASLPIIGNLVGQLGLPHILLVGLVTTSIWQISIFIDIVKHLGREFKDPSAVARRSGMYALLYHLSDTSGLYLVSARTKILWMSIGKKKFGDRYHSYIARVPEMVFQGWFSVSVLALLIGSDRKYSLKQVSQILFSVITTAVASAMSFYDMASILLPWSKRMLELSGTNAHCARLKWNVPTIIIFMILHVVAFAMISARFVGVWACKSNEFAISSMACSE